MSYTLSIPEYNDDGIVVFLPIKYYNDETFTKRKAKALSRRFPQDVVQVRFVHLFDRAAERGWYFQNGQEVERYTLPPKVSYTLRVCDQHIKYARVWPVWAARDMTTAISAAWQAEKASRGDSIATVSDENDTLLYGYCHKQYYTADAIAALIATRTAQHAALQHQLRAMIGVGQVTLKAVPNTVLDYNDFTGVAAFLEQVSDDMIALTTVLAPPLSKNLERSRMLVDLAIQVLTAIEDKDEQFDL